jgi:hypothetical protein
MHVAAKPTIRANETHALVRSGGLDLGSDSVRSIGHRR